jgi:hypothetical protein
LASERPSRTGGVRPGHDFVGKSTLNVVGHVPIRFLLLVSGASLLYIRSIKRGLRNVALVNICKLAKASGVSPADLMKF